MTEEQLGWGIREIDLILLIHWKDIFMKDPPPNTGPRG